MPNEPIQPQDKYVVRFPDGLRNELKLAALANGRSLNAEIVARLEESLVIGEVGRDVTAIVGKLSEANDDLSAQVQALSLQIDMSQREQRILTSDLAKIEELRELKASIASSEDAALKFIAQKYRDGFEFMAKFYAASVSDRRGRDQMGDLLRATGFHSKPNDHQ